MADMMLFPDTVEEFMEQYRVTDTKQVYTNGADLVPIFRMKQWFEHLPSAQQWNVIHKRPMTEDERAEWSERLGYDIEYEDAYIYSNLPDDGQDVLVSTQYGRVYVDTFYQDEGCYFEENGDMEGIVAWMPFPEPYKGNGTD